MRGGIFNQKDQNIRKQSNKNTIQKPSVHLNIYLSMPGSQHLTE